MHTLFTWKKSLLSGTYNIYSQLSPVGFLNKKIFSNTADAEFKGVRYYFKTSGLFVQKTTIYDRNENVLGTIRFNNILGTSEIVIDGKVYSLKSESSWNKNWTMTGGDAEISYKKSVTKGEFISSIDNPLLLLSGLFILDYFVLLSTFMISIFVIVLFLY